MGGVVDESKWSALCATRSVSLPLLMLFLVVQMFHERSQRQPVGELNQEAALAFIKQHLHDVVSAAAVTKPGKITQADLVELQPMLREFSTGVEEPLGTSLSFLWSRSEKMIDVAVLSQFLRPRIVLPTDVRSSFVNNVTVKGIVNSVHILPQPMSAASASTARLPSSSFRISRGAQTSFYVTSELPNTILSQLHNCQVSLGPVSGVLSIDRCESCSITALCTAVVVSNCKDVTVFVCCNTPPVIGEGVSSSSAVRFAPYNSHYSTLEEHLASTGLNPKLNLWRCGVDAAMQLPPDEFYSVSFPIAPQAAAVVTTRTNPCYMPREYSDALNARVRQFSKMSSELRDAFKQLESAGRKDLAEALRSKVHTMFLDWVYEKGQAKGLMDLLHQNLTAAAPSTPLTK
jgi:TBCC domain-containing protein 1